MIVTDNKIPVPEPIAPKKSATIVKAPMHIPPNVAAMGIYLFKTSLTLLSLKPTTDMSYSLSYLATSLGDDPETSIQVFEKIAQVPRMNTE